MGVVAVVHCARDETILPARLLALAQRLHLGEDRLAVGEIVIGRLMADAGLARHLAHAEPVEPALLDQGKARIQHFLAEIRGFSHGELFGVDT